MNLQHDVWEHYLTFTAQLVGFCARAGPSSRPRCGSLADHMKRPLQAYVAAISTGLFSMRATAVGSDEILALPYPDPSSLDLSGNEQILVDDITDYYRDLIRFGDGSEAMKESGQSALSVSPAFSFGRSTLFTTRIKSVPSNPKLAGRCLPAVRLRSGENRLERGGRTEG